MAEEDTRRKDVNWRINKNERGSVNEQQAQLAVMMDIRDELKALNRVFACYQFQGIPRTLKTIDKRLQQAGCLTRKKKRRARK